MDQNFKEHEKSFHLYFLWSFSFFFFSFLSPKVSSWFWSIMSCLISFKSQVIVHGATQFQQIAHRFYSFYHARTRYSFIRNDLSLPISLWWYVSSLCLTCDHHYETRDYKIWMWLWIIYIYTLPLTLSEVEQSRQCSMAAIGFHWGEQVNEELNHNAIVLAQNAKRRI